jgi:NAD(P)-dependent dehydrogenase (short-subunit alcohol dehydrogenase family)
MTKRKHWISSDIPDQSGKIAIVTGGNVGLGYETVKALASKGAHVLLACRNLEKGIAARDRVQQLAPGVSIEVMRLDLANLASIRVFAEEFRAKYDRLHILVNNGGVMATPRLTTADGFELQFGTNHLGHFALAGLLLDLFLNSPMSRVVTVSSLAERFGRMNFHDLRGKKSYNRWIAYCQSKLANLLFAYELQRRLGAARSTAISLAAHPGFTSTNLRTKLRSQETPWFHRFSGIFFDWISRSSAEQGALPQLYAATAPDVRGGEYYGPDGLFQISGDPRRMKSSRQSYNEDLARRLWNVSEELTGIEVKIS